MPNVNIITFLYFLLLFSNEAQKGLSEIPFQSKGYSLCIIWAWVVHYWGTLNIHWKDWCCSWSFNTLATWCGELSHWKRPWCWERLMAKGEGGSRGWDSWMASPTEWTLIWANPGRQWRTGKSGVLQSMRSQRVRKTKTTRVEIPSSP